MITHLISFFKKLFIHQDPLIWADGGFFHRFRVAICPQTDGKWVIFLAQSTAPKVEIYSYPTEREARLDYISFITSRQITVTKWANEEKALSKLVGEKL